MTMVVDASVACKWYFEESGSELALLLLDSEETLAAPAFIRLEVASIIWKRQRKNLVGSVADRLILSDLARNLELIADDNLVLAAYEIAKTIDHSVYDCLYLATTQKCDAILVTADEQLVRRVEGTPWAGLVVSLVHLPNALTALTRH